MTARPALLLLALGLMLVACQPDNESPARRTRFLMGTLVEIVLADGADKKAEEAANRAFAEMARLEAMFSSHQPDSLLSRVNGAAGGDFTPVPKEFLEVVRRGLAWGAASRGALALTLGPVVELWHFDAEASGPPPSPQVLKEALTRVDDAAIELRGDQIRLARPGMKLDLGAIAKGYAVDRALAVLLEGGVENALINAGGDLAVLGRPSPGHAWKVGLQHPRKPEALIAALDAEGIAVATSGDYQRYYLHNGVRYHHILTPATGMPAAGLIAVTVAAPSTADADALATAVFVLGRDKGLKWIESIEGVEAMVVDASLETEFSSGFKNLPGFELTGF